MGNGSTKDFLAHRGEISGRDLDELFQGVLQGALQGTLIGAVPEYEKALPDGLISRVADRA